MNKSELSKREILKTVYPSKGWAAKVDRMSNGQVIAIYFRLKQQGKI